MAFPNVKNSWIIFGGGFGLSRLQPVTWLKNCQILYWGDIDTHGFAALDELRSVLPDVKSILMDHETLLAHREFWGFEDKPRSRTLTRLRAEEQQLYQDLQNHRLGQNLRLEQERVSMSALRKILIGKGLSLIATFIRPFD